MRMKYPTQAEIKEFLIYDPETGIFKWKYREKFKTVSAKAAWNSRFPGTIAGTPDTKGHTMIAIHNRLYSAHRLAFIYVHGFDPPQEIDHRNRVKGDNKITNIRMANGTENNINKGLQKNNTSGVCGVIWHSKSQTWHTWITKNRKKHWLGQFKIFTEAVRARYNAEAKYGFTEFNQDSTAKQYLQEATQ